MIFCEYTLFHKIKVTPMQLPCKSYVSPIFRLFYGTDLQRTWNGPETVL